MPSVIHLFGDNYGYKEIIIQERQKHTQRASVQKKNMAAYDILFSYSLSRYFILIGIF